MGLWGRSKTCSRLGGRCVSRLLCFILLAGSIAAAALPAAAQETPEALSCTFDDGASRSDGARAQRRADDSIELRFIGIDLTSGAAELVEGGSTRRIAAMASGHVVTFVEVMPSGNVSMTTVSALPSNDRRLAVYSRHVFGSVAPSYVASQYYGSCVEAE